MMGIRDELLVEGYEDAERLFDAIMARNRRESDEGQRLTEALVTFLERTIKENNPLSRVLPLRHIPKMLISYLVGKETASMVGVGLNWRKRAAAAALKVIVWTVGNSRQLPLTGRIAEWLFREMLVYLQKMGRGLDRELFYIPTELGESLRRKKLSRVPFPWFSRPHRSGRAGRRIAGTLSAGHPPSPSGPMRDAWAPLLPEPRPRRSAAVDADSVRLPQSRRLGPSAQATALPRP